MDNGDIALLVLAAVACAWVAPALGLFLFIMLTEWWNGRQIAKEVARRAREKRAGR